VHLLVVSIYTSLVTNDVGVFPRTYWSFVYLLWSDVYSNLLVFGKNPMSNFFIEL
jgi:hypothetical protein